MNLVVAAKDRLNLYPIAKGSFSVGEDLPNFIVRGNLSLVIFMRNYFVCFIVR